MNAVVNRGKEMIRLNLKDPVDHKRALDLLCNCDVVVENFRPGTMARLGLDPKEIHRINPTAIILSMPGYASTDVDRCNIQAFEGLMMADTGVFSDMGLNRILMGIPASYSALPLASIYGGVAGTLAVLSALYAREVHSHGDIIEVPLASALLDCLVYNSWEIGETAERYKCVREREIERREKESLPMCLSFKELEKLLDPFYRTYFCGDGRPVYIVAPCHAIHQRRSLECLGVWDEMVADGLPQGDVYLPSSQWPGGAQCLLGTYPISSYYWMDKLTKRMSAAFKTKAAFEWEALFGAAKVPVGAHRTAREFLNSEHALSSELTVEVETEKYGTMRQKGKCFWLRERTEVPPTFQPAKVQTASEGP